MLKKLIKIANELDKKGLRKEADYLDSLLGKTAGRDEGMEHEEHAKYLETPGAEAGEEMHNFYARENAKMADARKVAEWIVGGTPVFGQDAETDIDELTDTLSADEHTATVKAILDFFSGKKELVLEKGSPPDAGAEKETEYDAFDPYKPQGDLKQQEAEARAREAMAQTGATIKELERTIGGSKRERSTHQNVDLGDLLES